VIFVFLPPPFKIFYGKAFFFCGKVAFIWYNIIRRGRKWKKDNGINFVVIWRIGKEQGRVEK